MLPPNPIVLIDDDDDDREILKSVLDELGYADQYHFFENCGSALAYLETTSEQPLIIFCDINLPGMTGIKFKRRINEDEYLRKKAIPFVFLTTTSDPRTIEEVYDMMVQGFFTKPDSIGILKKTMKLILDYWTVCKHPNNLNLQLN